MEKWFRPSRCGSTGLGRLGGGSGCWLHDGEVAGGVYDLLISAPRVNLFHHPYARARELMARPWSARCYGVARQREGSRQNSIGGSGVLSLRHFGLVLLIPWRVGAEESGAAKYGKMISAVAMLLDRLGPPGRWQRLLAARWRGRRRSFDLLISAPRVNPLHHPYARARGR